MQDGKEPIAFHYWSIYEALKLKHPDRIITDNMIQKEIKKDGKRDDKKHFAT